MLDFFKELSKKTGKDRRSLSEAGLWKDKIGIYLSSRSHLSARFWICDSNFARSLFARPSFLSTTSMRCLAAATTRLNAVRARALAGFSTAFFGSLIPSERMVSVARSTQPPEYGANAGMPKRSVMVAAKESVTVSSPCTTKMWDGFYLNPSIQFRRPFISACPLIPARTSIRALTSTFSPKSRTDSGLLSTSLRPRVPTA